MPTESLREAILPHLEKINYPGFNRSIISFGVVSDIILTEDNITLITLSFSTKDNKVKDQIILSVTDIIKLKFPNDSIQIKIVDLPTCCPFFPPLVCWSSSSYYFIEHYEINRIFLIDIWGIGGSLEWALSVRRRSFDLA